MKSGRSGLAPRAAAGQKPDGLAVRSGNHLGHEVGLSDRQCSDIKDGGRLGRQCA
ncbi:MAG: hypothetical protein ACP5O1_10920 [Phycisphaerae bacterium]